jgi:hypothetical protein
MPMRRALLAALLISAAACGSKDDAAPAGAAASEAPASSGDDLADISSYKLTMDKMDKFYAAQRNMAVKAKAMSPAEREALKQDDDAGDGSVDDFARKIESTPAMRDAVREAGLSPREFALLTMSAVQSGMAAAVLKMRPNDDADSLAREMKANMDNIRFMQENEAELTRKQQALQAEMKQMGIDQES